MKRWLLVLAACSSKSSSPPPPAGSAAPRPVEPSAPAIPRPTMKSSRPIDLPDAGITKLHIVPIVAMGNGATDGKQVEVEKGVFDVEWMSSRKLATGIVCRVDSYNLAYFGMPDLDDDAKPDEHEVLYRPDPFAVDPKVCEVRFVGDNHAVVARACYQDGAMTEGACPAGTFPAPKLPDGMTIRVEGASVHPNNGSIGVKAMFTLAAPLPDTKTTFSLVCDGVSSEPDAGEGFVPLSKLAAGETLYTWELSFFMTKPVPAPKACELRIDHGKRLGTFCISEGSTEPGACHP